MGDFGFRRVVFAASNVLLEVVWGFGAEAFLLVSGYLRWVFVFDCLCCVVRVYNVLLVFIGMCVARWWCCCGVGACQWWVILVLYFGWLLGGCLVCFLSWGFFDWFG